MKKFFAIILAALLLLTFASCKKIEEEGETNENVLENESEIYEDADSGDVFTYAVNEIGTYEILDFTSKNNEPHKVEIPDEIDNIEVSGIAADAFKVKNYISEVVIPESVVYIGDYAFYGCNYLTKVVMADSVKEIGIGAFDSCIALASVNISANIKVVSEFAFRNCTALASLTIPASVEEIQAGAFRDCETLKELTIPETVKVIGDCAFYGCTALEKATLPAEIESCGRFVFTASKEGFKIVGEAGSWAETYATENGHVFEAVVVETVETTAETTGETTA
ncbi:MAG: leucine-rich repeat domain-containing protein [Clostridia bacterium]|nr:leucine-rich repeat domain-containing protein [Clostridia bacterium]